MRLAPKYWLETVSKLEGRWRAMLVRPWEPDVLLSAKIEPARSAAEVTLERAA